MITINGPIFMTTDVEIQRNIASYNCDMLHDASDEILDKINECMINNKYNTTIADIINDTESVPFIIESDPVELVKGYPFACLELKVTEALENEKDFIVIINTLDGKTHLINSKDIDY